MRFQHFCSLSRGSPTSMAMLSISYLRKVMVVLGAKFFSVDSGTPISWQRRQKQSSWSCPSLFEADYENIISEMYHVCNVQMLHCCPVNCCTQLSQTHGKTTVIEEFTSPVNSHEVVLRRFYWYNSKSLGYISFCHMCTLTNGFDVVCCVANSLILYRCFLQWDAIIDGCTDWVR